MYYVLDEYDGPHRWIKSTPYLEDISFWNGSTITEKVPEPLEFSLKPQRKNSDHGPKLPALYDEKIPLWRDDLIEALTAWNVSNFQTFEATLYDPDNETFYSNYKAVNLLALISCANLQKSGTALHDEIPSIDVDFNGLCVDEKRTGGKMLFRLAESVSTVLVHEKLRNYLENRGFADELQFWEPGEIAI